MTQYRKKPVVIEAFQMTRERRSDNKDWPEWLNEAWNKKWPEPGAVSSEDFPSSDGKDRLVIATLEGVHTVSWGDWIIRGVSGELYPCKPAIFEATYEPAAEAPKRKVFTARDIRRWHIEFNRLSDFQVIHGITHCGRRVEARVDQFGPMDEFKAAQTLADKLNAEPA
jgi:hypothetical protein